MSQVPIAVVGGTHHGETIWADKRSRQLRTAAKGNASHIELYELVKKHDGKLFYVFRPDGKAIAARHEPLAFG